MVWVVLIEILQLTNFYIRYLLSFFLFSWSPSVRMILEKLYFPFILSIIAKTLIQAKTTQFDCTNKTKYKSEHQNTRHLYFSTGGLRMCGWFLNQLPLPRDRLLQIKGISEPVGFHYFEICPRVVWGTSHQQWSRQRQNKCSLMRLSRVACGVRTDDWTGQMALSPSPQNNTAKNIYSPGNDSFFACPDFSYK